MRVLRFKRAVVTSLLLMLFWDAQKEVCLTRSINQNIQINRQLLGFWGFGVLVSGYLLGASGRPFRAAGWLLRASGCQLEVSGYQLEASCGKFGASQRKLGELESFFKEAPKNINCVISLQIWKNLALHWLANISGSPGPILLNFWCNNIYIQFSIQWWNPHLSILSQKNTADQERQPSSMSFCKKQWFSVKKWKNRFFQKGLQEFFWNLFYCV